MYSTQTILSVRKAVPPVTEALSESATFEALFLGQPIEKLAAGSALFWEGDPASHLFQVVEGCLRLYRILADGRRAIMGFRFAGETLGFSCQGLYDYTAEAVSPVRLRRLSRSRLHVMEQGTVGLQSLLLAQIFDEMRAAQKHIIVLGQLGAEERVANFLISVALRMGADRRKPIIIDLPMTRQDIADYLGLTIETVCRAMSKLKRDGAITLNGRHKVVLRNMSDLRNLAGMEDELSEPAEGSVFVYLPN